MATWRFFDETGAEGGTVAGNSVMYVDSHNGSDVTGTGTHDNPVATIQRAVDVIPSCVMVLAGYFEQSEIVGSTYLFLYAEGGVVIEGNGATRLGTTTAAYAVYCNYSTSYGVRNYGTLTIQNYASLIPAGSSHGYAYNTKFINVTSVYGGSAGVLRAIVGCIFVNSTLGTGAVTQVGNVSLGGTELSHNTFINSNFNCIRNGQYFNFRSNHFDPTSKIWLYSIGVSWKDMFTNGMFNYNHFEGDITDKIITTTPSGNYDNVEDFKVANPEFETNGLGSAVLPLFTNPSNEDYTLQPTSPLIKVGHDKQQIGALNLGGDIDTSDNTYFDHGLNFDVSAGEVTLAVGGAQTFETRALFHHRINDKKRLILKTLSPNLEQNFGLGETMGSLASETTPFKTDIEMKFSSSDSLTNGVDDDTTYNANWLKVPVGEQPFIDANGRGNDDPLFDFNTKSPIKAKYVKLRITLRDNETQI